MTDQAAGGKRRTVRRAPQAVSEGAYRPSHVPARVTARSPYPSRPRGEPHYREEEGSEVSAVVERREEEEEGGEERVGDRSEDQTIESEPEGEATTGMESEVDKLLRYMAEKEERDRASRAEADKARRLEMLEIVGRLKESEEERRREDEARRRERDEDSRVRRLGEEAEQRDKRELQAEKLKILGSYKEGTEMLGYLSKFERIMSECKIKESQWAERLFPRLPERLCNRIAGVRDDGGSYEVVKGVLLKAIGETSLTYGHQLFELTGESLKMKGASEIMEVVERICRGVLQGCSSREDCVAALAAALTRRVIPPGGKVFLEGKKLTKLEDIRDAWETWMSGRMKGNFYKVLGSSTEGGFKSFRESGSRSQVSTGSERVSLVPVCFNCGEKGHKAPDCKKKVGGLNGVSRPVTCFACGKQGHRSPDCPSRKIGTSVKKEGTTGSVSRVVMGAKKGNMAKGVVNGVECGVLIDSGAEVGIVPRSMVTKDCVLCGHVHIADVHGKTSVHESTLVSFEIGGLKFSKLCVIEEREGEDVTCIVPYDVLSNTEGEAFRRAITEYRGGGKKEKGKSVNVVTRSRAKELAELEVCDVDCSVQDLWCTIEESDPSSQLDPLIRPEVSSKVGESHGVEKVGPTEMTEQPQANGESSSGLRTDENAESESESVDEGMPVAWDKENTCDEAEKRVRALAGEIGYVGSGKDREEFVRALAEDEGLKLWRELGEKKERGFEWKKGVLVRGQYVEWEQFRDVLVVPKKFRKRILVLGHEKGGHLGSEKVAQMVGRYFTWPGMVRDILEHCSSCKLCQVRSKHKPRRAPIVERPVMTEPFESVAVDLVGPLPKGKGGCRFLLTYVCLASRWPEAVPLRSITAKAVAEGLWGIFSRTSVPERMLSDQGSQFCGRVVRELCSLLGIEKLRTSPYHPETNGAVERMHGTFKGILGKCVSDGVDWVGQVNFVLYVLRQMPHADSGFSPFDLVYGYRVRTPLDALYHGLYEVDSQKLNVCEWVRGMAERLERMRECAAVKMVKGKQSRLSYMNRGCKLREFKAGQLVLYRVPGMHSKLADSWEGPYRVKERLGKVNYRINALESEKHVRVVHVNCLKEYKERLEVNRVDVVLEEEVSKRNVLSGECEGFVKGELDELLGRYECLFEGKPGCTDRVELTIDTGDVSPIRQTPYSVPLGVRDEVKKELDLLEESGIIERSSSPWASPLVPVKKKDGGIRLCVDFRKVNGVTVREPYYIPGFDEMIERVGVGRVLSKLDLEKGFHQVVVRKEDREKTAFVCPFGKFQFRRMPFGLTNAPSVFQRLMDQVLVPCSDYARVYIDDVLVVSECWEVHLKHLEEVFEVLKVAGLTVKRKKCVFGKRKLEFLGHLIGDGVVSVPGDRVRAIADHPMPRSRKQLRSFLGLVGFYRRFVRGMHRWTAVLTPHTSGLACGRIVWTSSMVEAFRELCLCLCNSIVLCVPQKEDSFMLECDACSSGIGAVLSVRREDEWRPVAFFSHQLKGAQQRYSAQELECLAVVEAASHFAYFLYGKHFEIVTDHRGLESLVAGKQCNRRVQGWALKMSEFSFSITYRKGSENIVADALSRCHEDVGDGESEHLFQEGGDVGVEREPLPHETLEREDSS